MTEIAAFTSVVDEGGFTNASVKLRISKSTVSKQVSSLEARLGVQLLKRSTRRVTPTEIGMAYYDRARRLLHDAGEADALVTSMKAGLAGVLHILVPPAFGITQVAPALTAFCDTWPQLRVSMTLSDQDVDLMDGSFDLAIRIGDIGGSKLLTRKICETNWRMIASSGYLKRFGRPTRIEDLDGHRLLQDLSGPLQGRWKFPKSSGSVIEVRTPSRLVASESLPLLNATIAGLGIAHLPSFLCADALKKGLVEEVLPDLPGETQPINAVYPLGRSMPPKVGAFFDFLVEVLSEKGPDSW
jgi:DNA-binding transcriptional LysR family regulator